RTGWPGRSAPPPACPCARTPPPARQRGWSSRPARTRCAGGGGRSRGTWAQQTRGQASVVAAPACGKVAEAGIGDSVLGIRHGGWPKSCAPPADPAVRSRGDLRESEQFGRDQPPHGLESAPVDRARPEALERLEVLGRGVALVAREAVAGMEQ